MIIKVEVFCTQKTFPSEPVQYLFFIIFKKIFYEILNRLSWTHSRVRRSISYQHNQFTIMPAKKKKSAKRKPVKKAMKKAVKKTKKTAKKKTAKRK